MAHIRIGVGGWVFEEWRDNFYPKGLSQKRELEYASRHLTAIEVNGTYYGSQKPESFARWHDETPDDFVFTLKGPRFATNRRVLAEAGDSIEKFVESGITRLKAQAGADQLAIHGDQEIRSRRISPPSCRCCRKSMTASRCAMPSKCAMPVSPAPNSWRCAASTTSRSSPPATANFP